MSPLGKAIDSMVERLEAAKIQGGLSRDTEVQSSKNEKAGTDNQKAVGDLTRTYNDLQKSFALCGIAIDPPFPSLHRRALRMRRPPSSPQVLSSWRAVRGRGW